MAGEYIYECEIRRWHEDVTTPKRARRWVVISVEEALQLGDVIRRCKECHGPIRLHRPARAACPERTRSIRRGIRGARWGTVTTGSFGSLRILSNCSRYRTDASSIA